MKKYATIKNSGLLKSLREKLKKTEDQEKHMQFLLARYDELIAAGQVPTEEEAETMERIRKLVSYAENHKFPQ